MHTIAIPCRRLYNNGILFEGGGGERGSCSSSGNIDNPQNPLSCQGVQAPGIFKGLRDVLRQFVTGPHLLPLVTKQAFWYQLEIRNRKSRQPTGDRENQQHTTVPKDYKILHRGLLSHFFFPPLFNCSHTGTIHRAIVWLAVAKGLLALQQHSPNQRPTDASAVPSPWLHGAGQKAGYMSSVPA